jgi:hypothetical protein
MSYRRKIEAFNLVIEEGIPIPNPYKTNVSPVTTKMLSMKVGQSFIWPHKLATPVQISVTLNQIRKRYGVKFAYRKVEGGDIRVWRVDENTLLPRRKVFHTVRKDEGRGE